jgi:hypothetical protein
VQPAGISNGSINLPGDKDINQSLNKSKNPLKEGAKNITKG